MGRLGGYYVRKVTTDLVFGREGVNKLSQLLYKGFFLFLKRNAYVTERQNYDFISFYVFTLGLIAIIAF